MVVSNRTKQSHEGCSLTPKHRACEETELVDSIPYSTDVRTVLASANVTDAEVSCGSTGPTAKTLWYSLSDLIQSDTATCIEVSLQFDVPASVNVASLSGSSCGTLQCDRNVVLSPGDESAVFRLPRRDPLAGFFLVLSQPDSTFGSSFVMSLKVR